LNETKENSVNDESNPTPADSPAPTASDSEATSKPNPDAEETSIPLTFAQVLVILEKGKFEEIKGLIQWSSNYTFLASVAHEDVELPVVYKPQKGERPLWDFPDGTLCYRERAAFLISDALEWQIVPPTVLREGPQGLGSVQFFVDHDPNHHYFEFDNTMLPQLARIALFDAIINNADRKGGHCIVDEEGNLWGIDHGIAFHNAPKLRTVIWDFAGQAIPKNYLDDITKLTAKLNNGSDPLNTELGTLLSERELKALKKRLNRLATDQSFPNPRNHGPNQPWPPV
jgi:hypothetical protein